MDKTKVHQRKIMLVDWTEVQGYYARIGSIQTK